MTLTLAYSAPASQDSVPDSPPSNVTQLPTPDRDISAAARLLIDDGWTALDAFHAGLDQHLAAAIWMLEANTP